MLDDGTLDEFSEGKQLYSLNLKSINRNYFRFNELLIENGLLDVEGLHNNDPKRGKIKCRSYNIPPEIILKGIRREFLSWAERKELIKGITTNRGPDKTDLKRSPVLRYFHKLLGRMTIDLQALDKIEIEVERFCHIHRAIGRIRQRKFDLFRNLKTDRLSSVYLDSPREFRKLLRLDGKSPLAEGDVAACHFHFLLAKMTDGKEREMMMKDLVSSDPYLAMCGNPIGVSREALKQSSHKFKYGNRIVNKYGLTDLELSQAIPYRDQLFYQHISKRYPVFSEAMASEYIRHPKHRSDFACDVMKKESRIMVQEVGERCRREKLIYLPVHDGFMTLPTQYDRVCEVVTECFREAVGSVPLIRRK